MFKAGTDLKGKSIDEVIQGDIKNYESNKKTFAISQVITLNSEGIMDRKNEYIKKLNEIKSNRGYDIILLCVTDIIEGGYYIFFDEESSTDVALAFGLDKIDQGYFFDKCLSRKKQLVPLIMNVVK